MINQFSNLPLQKILSTRGKYEMHVRFIRSDHFPYRPYGAFVLVCFFKLRFQSETFQMAIIQTTGEPTLVHFVNIQNSIKLSRCFYRGAGLVKFLIRSSNTSVAVGGRITAN